MYLNEKKIQNQAYQVFAELVICAKEISWTAARIQLA